MSLAEVQRLFWRAITWPTGVDDFVAQADPDTVAAIEATFAQTTGFGRGERLQVYAEAYFWRLAGIMAEHFEVTAWLCGHKRFQNLLTDYVLANPSEDPNVGRYGERLPAFLAAHPENERIEGLADIAAIEWAMVAAIDGPDDPLLAVEDLAAVELEAWPQLRFIPAATTGVYPCRLQFAELFEACRAGQRAPELTRDPHWVVVWRKEFDVYHRRLPDTEAAALREVIGGGTFAAATAAAGSPERAAALLQRWLRAGLFKPLASPGR